MPLLRDCKSSKLWAIEMPIARADKWVCWYLSATRQPTSGYAPIGYSQTDNWVQ